MLICLRWINPPTTSVQIQRRIEASLKHWGYRKRYTFVRLKYISIHLQHAVIAAEDSRFYRHHGVDWEEMEKVVEEKLERGRLRGGSTISQQLLKNLFLTTYRNPLRKAVEFSMVYIEELILPKHRILELYLNVIEWGPGIYGAEAASRYYYRIPAARLNRDQAARLAACIPSPLTRRPAHMDDYSAEILARMQRMGW